MRLPAISVRQPWAWAIFNGKDVENRTWRPPAGLLGERILIHASKRTDQNGFDFCEQLGLHVPDSLPTGAIIGSVVLLNTTEDSESPWFFGPVGWMLSKPRLLPNPIQTNGKLGIWYFNSPSVKPSDMTALGFAPAR